MKVNHCPDVVSPRDIMVMEMLEYNQLIKQRTAIEYALHDCLFTAAHDDAWSRGITLEQLRDYYAAIH